MYFERRDYETKIGNCFYEASVKEKKITKIKERIPEATGVIVAPLPMGFNLGNNQLGSLGNPEKDSFCLIGHHVDIPDGEYILVFDQAYHSRGWSSGTNWYGISVMKP